MWCVFHVYCHVGFDEGQTETFVVVDSVLANGTGVFSGYILGSFGTLVNSLRS
jgi:hypothetical protein